ncbi:MAG: hypothetical protein GY718_10000 [Lentisphaerae bacterium]|nr:hypothetical protein [Lentisphaerota bacterium]
MIKILLHDKKGREVCNGDTIRWFEIQPGDRFRVTSPTCQWREDIVPLDVGCQDLTGLITKHQYDVMTLCNIFSVKIPGLNESALPWIREVSGLDVNAGLPEILETINGFEIVS